MVIEIKEVSKDFKKINVLHSVTIKFESGNIYGFVGRNGSGKSVLLKMICGFYKPTTGTILFNDVDIIKNDFMPIDTRALIEKPNFIDDLSGMDNLKMLADIQNKISDKDIMDAVEKVNLENDINKKYKTYSLGTKQKLGIVQVIMENPEVMIFDEPFNGVENMTVEKVKKLLLEYKKSGKLIIIASHIKEDIQQLSDIVYEFNNGTVNKIND